MPAYWALGGPQASANHANKAEIARRPEAMWRSLHRKRLKFVVAAARCLSLFAVAIAFLAGLGSEARAQEEQLSAAGPAGQHILIREHAGWNRNCEAIAHPALYLSEPPRHGKVCVRVENIKISSMFVGTESQCIGRLVRGVRLIYRPDTAYAGDDSLRYAAQYPLVLRAVHVQVTATANTAGATSAPPSNVVAPMTEIRQAPGPVPDCAEPIF